MRDVAAHAAAARALVSPLPVVSVPLDDALGRVLAYDVVALWPSPPFTNSAMDGYALQGADAAAASADAPVLLTLVGEAAAGRPFEGTVSAGQAVSIMTGAVVPEGADAVVPVERASDDGAVVSVREAPRPAAHIRRVGEDVGEGETVLKSGTVLTAARLAAAASVGHATVPTRPSAVVAILATGDELVAPGVVPGPGQIADSNSVVLAGLVRAAGATVLRLPHTSDDPDALLDALHGVGADLIVTTGGVSKGAYDVVKGALARRGVDFVDVAMQPGKPQGLGLVNGVPIACLPGNPVSVLVSFAVFVRPMLRVLQGEADPSPRTAVAAEGWNCPAGRQQYMPVRWVGDGEAGRGEVAPATARGSGSHLVASLAKAEALAVIPAETDQVRAGDTVVVMEIGG
jgi:molybdopterin molybdotransferase